MAFFYNKIKIVVTKVIYNMATMPQREKALEETIKRILPQCDYINIYLNNFESIPAFLKSAKICIFKSQDHYGDLGDVGKFFKCNTWEDAYIFTVDDKILYPDNYTQKMIAVIEKYKRQAVVSCHGRIFFDRPCKTYYFDNKEYFCFANGLPEDRFVHELGTGCTAFHTDTIPQIDLKIFETTNMSDIWFSVWLQKLNVPIVIPARKDRWLFVSRKHDDSYSIHNFCNKNDQFQTEVINKNKWKINKINL